MKESGGRARGCEAWLLAGLLGASAALAPQTLQAGERLTFIGVALDPETRRADRILQDYLHRKAGVELTPEELEYGRVIDRLANWRDREGAYVARLTPYVHVAAEMLGADFETLGTYIGTTTGQTTYSAYFVVRRSEFQGTPELADVLRYLRLREQPARFVFHSRFSTSSYLLPSLHFRSHGVFHMAEPSESLIAIRSEQISQNSSTELVRLVASGEADLAAVWDGTKVKFEPGHSADLAAEYGNRVHFVRLPTRVPNDLLVCSAGIDTGVKQRLAAAIDAMEAGEIGEGDFDSWRSIREATEARLALADLRWSARVRSAPVTLSVTLAADEPVTAAAAALLEATRQGVRLAGDEFVLFDPDYHEQMDFRWVVEPIHDDAIVLHSEIPGSDIPEQRFQLSFLDVEGLTRRIDDVIHSRIHRIRYVWPFSEDAPLVIRDTTTTVPANTMVRVQRISWIDPARNSFRAGPFVDARVIDSGFYKFELAPEDFRRVVGETGELDAMSNVAYRVIVAAPEGDNPLLRGLTVAFVVLLVLAGTGAVIDLRRRSGGAPAQTEPSSDDTRSLANPSDGSPRYVTPVAKRGPRPPEQWH